MILLVLTFMFLWYPLAKTIQHPSASWVLLQALETQLFQGGDVKIRGHGPIQNHPKLVFVPVSPNWYLPFDFTPLLLPCP